jgi:hypothetical protein
MGRLLADEGSHGAAVPHLEKALEFRAYDDRLRIDLAKAYRLAGSPDRALTLLVKTRVREDFARMYHFELAQVYRTLRRDADAQAHTQQVRNIEQQKQKEITFVPASVYVH